VLGPEGLERERETEDEAKESDLANQSVSWKDRQAQAERESDRKSKTRLESNTISKM